MFKGDLSELYDTDITDYQFAAVKAEKNVPDTICHKYFSENKNEYIYWSGLMLINCKRFRTEGLLDKLIVNAKRLFGELRFFDLDLINITCDNIYQLDMKYCVMQSIYCNSDYKIGKEYRYLSKVYTDSEIERSKRDTVIVHYGGKPGKPWRMKHPYEDYQKCMDSLPKELKKYTFRDVRKKMFSKV